jgi:phosphoribosyl 1,2-cyclic phosphodiesterase
VKFASLGSGSKGNAMLVWHQQTCVMVDCGFSARETEQRLAQLAISAESLSGILLTHEHGDHIRGAGALARKYGLPVWATRGTAAHLSLGKLPDLRCIDVHQNFAIEALEVQPFPVPHDAREPCQYVFSDGQARLGILTDTGSITNHICEQLSGCDALVLECNHDSEMLAEGPYPASLKQRVGGRLGHLSNTQAAGLLAEIDTGSLQHLVAAHLSEQNNSCQAVRQALSEVLGCESDWISIADQETGFDWREI